MTGYKRLEGKDGGVGSSVGRWERKREKRELKEKLGRGCGFSGKKGGLSPLLSGFLVERKKEGRKVSFFFFLSSGI